MKFDFHIDTNNFRHILPEEMIVTIYWDSFRPCVGDVIWIIDFIDKDDITPIQYKFFDDQGPCIVKQVSIWGDVITVNIEFCTNSPKEIPVCPECGLTEHANMCPNNIINSDSYQYRNDQM